MALPIREQVTYWGVAGAVFLLVLWFLGDVLLPFVLGAAIAYCLDPIADRLQRLGMSRILATLTITVFAILIFVLMALLVIPTLIQQTEDLIRTAPQLFQGLQSALTDRFPQLLDENSIVRQSLVDIGEAIRSRGGAFANQVVTSASSSFQLSPSTCSSTGITWSSGSTGFYPGITRRRSAVLPRISTGRSLASFADREPSA